MKRNNILKYGLITVLLGIISAVAAFAHIFFTPHRDIQSVSTDFRLTASQLVVEYLDNPSRANDRYLDEEGESKVLEVTGVVADISEDFNGRKVVLLKSGNDKAGVSCTFLATKDQEVAGLSVGQTIVIKGMITAGASYDEDLGLYEHVLLDQCAIAN